MAAAIKSRYPDLYSITSSIEEDPCAAEIRALWEAKRTSGEAVDRVDPTPLTLVRHGRLTMSFASLNPSYEFAAGTAAPQ
jgi:hypothetical protein